MADLGSTRVFGKLTVMHDAIVKANAEITGTITAGSYVGLPTTATRWPTFAEVTSKPSFAAVATSGSFSDLSGSAAPSRYDLAVAATTATLDLAQQQVFTVDASTARTLSISNAPGAGRSMVVTIRFTSSVAPTWPTGINWSGGAEPELNTSWTVVTLLLTDGTWSGFKSGGAD